MSGPTSLPISRNTLRVTFIAAHRSTRSKTCGSVARKCSFCAARARRLGVSCTGSSASASGTMGWGPVGQGERGEGAARFGVEGIDVGVLTRSDEMMTLYCNVSVYSMVEERGTYSTTYIHRCSRLRIQHRNGAQRSCPLLYVCILPRVRYFAI